MNYEDLTPEQMEKAKTCTTVDELVELAKSEGHELSDEELEAIAGGETKWLCRYNGDCFGAIHSAPDAPCADRYCDTYTGRGW